MPFVRFARDKRGYEYIYLVHDSTRGNRASRPAVLYWYRTPPGIKVGRPPFDDEVRQRLEAQNPEIRFDWRAITSAQPPPPDAEHWRERRRAEKAAKLARLKEERVDQDAQADPDEDLEADDEPRADAEAGAPRVHEVAVSAPVEPSSGIPDATLPGESAAEGSRGEASTTGSAHSRRRRRGRRRRDRSGGSSERAVPPADLESSPAGGAAGPAPGDHDGAQDGGDSGSEEPEDS